MTVDLGEQLIRRLAALGDADQRVAVLAEEADRLGMTDFADLLAVIVARAGETRRDEEYLALVAAMQYLDSEHLSERGRKDLLEACRERGHAQILRLLFAPGDHRKADIERVPDYGSGRTLTLGERKALARRPTRKILERALCDPHPAVVRNLLDNPRLTELDVVRLVSRRPNYADVLRQVYRSRRWSSRYAVRVALARNPYTPPGLALKILPLLLRQDLAEMAQDKGLHQSVLLACRHLLEGEEEDPAGGVGGGGETLH